MSAVALSGTGQYAIMTDDQNRILICDLLNGRAAYAMLPLTCPL